MLVGGVVFLVDSVIFAYEYSYQMFAACIPDINFALGFF